MSEVPRNDRVRIAGWITVAALMLAATAWTAMAQAGPNAATTQSSTDRGVTLKVTSKSIGLQATRWEFSVVLDTHSADISEDLVQSATLTSGGRTHAQADELDRRPSRAAGAVQHFGIGGQHHLVQTSRFLHGGQQEADLQTFRPSRCRCKAWRTA